MAPHGRRPDAAGLGRRIWDHVRGRASSAPEEFTPHTCDGVTGWLWEGPFATLIREAVPGITDTDLRRAREYLNACGIVVNVRANQRGAQPQWFIRAHWHQGPGGHVHVVPTAAQASHAHRRRANPNRPGNLWKWRTRRAKTWWPRCSRSPSRYRSCRPTNDRLREDNDRLGAEVERIGALMRQVGGAVAQQAGQLLAGTGD
jgi:hypothetical protein